MAEKRHGDVFREFSLNPVSIRVCELPPDHFDAFRQHLLDGRKRTGSLKFFRHKELRADLGSAPCSGTPGALRPTQHPDNATRADTMSQVSHDTSAESSGLPQDLVLLRSHIESLSPEVREMLAPALSRVVESTQRRRRILGMVQDALGQLRLDMKYLMFDLEATRRERDDYRSRLEQS
jgi:hypothetical protein